jgi:hypothetical protein
MSGPEYVPLRFTGNGLCAERDFLAAEANVLLSKLWALLADRAGDAKSVTEAGLAEADLERFAVWLDDNLSAARSVAPDLAGHAADRACDLAREVA